MFVSLDSQLIQMNPLVDCEHQIVHDACLIDADNESLHWRTPSHSTHTQSFETSQLLHNLLLGFLGYWEVCVQCIHVCGFPNENVINEKLKRRRRIYLIWREDLITKFTSKRFKRIRGNAWIVYNFFIVSFNELMNFPFFIFPTIFNILIWHICFNGLIWSTHFIGNHWFLLGIIFIDCFKPRGRGRNRNIRQPVWLGGVKNKYYNGKRFLTERDNGSNLVLDSWMISQYDVFSVHSLANSLDLMVSFLRTENLVSPLFHS